MKKYTITVGKTAYEVEVEKVGVVADVDGWIAVEDTALAVRVNRKRLSSTAKEAIASAIASYVEEATAEEVAPATAPKAAPAPATAQKAAPAPAPTPKAAPATAPAPKEQIEKLKAEIRVKLKHGRVAFANTEKRLRSEVLESIVATATVPVILLTNNQKKGEQIKVALLKKYPNVSVGVIEPAVDKNGRLAEEVRGKVIILDLLPCRQEAKALRKYVTEGFVVRVVSTN